MTPIKQRVETLLAQMTLEEKLAQIGSCWMHELLTGGKPDPEKIKLKLGNGIEQITRVAGASTLDPVAAAKAGNRLQKFLVEETRLKIPAILHEESCSGAMLLGWSGVGEPLRSQRAWARSTHSQNE